MNLGRIVASVTIENVFDLSKGLRCDAVVDTVASHMVLPSRWKDRLGRLELTRTIELETSTHEILVGQVFGPVCIQIEGFRPIHTEVAFVEMKPDVGGFEPLLGHIVLLQSQAGVDMLGDRLIPTKQMD